MSFQGFQGVANTSSNTGGTDASRAALLKRTRDRIAKAKGKRELQQLINIQNNRTGTGAILDTNKLAGSTSKSPASKFNIIGGKAVGGGIGSNITSSVPSILRRDGTRVRAQSSGLSKAEKAALGIISGENQATNNLAAKIATRRRLEGLSGNTREQSQEIATSPDINSFTRADRNRINSTLQTDILRSNAAKLKFANRLISEQTSNVQGFNTLDDLQSQLDNAPNQNAPIQDINISTDQFGNEVSPRNVKLQIENAGFSGGLTKPILNVITSGGNDATKLGTNAPNVEEIAQTIRESLAESTDTAQVSGLTDIITNPDGTMSISFSEFAPEQFRTLFGGVIFESLGKFFDLRNQGVDDFFSNPEGLIIKIQGQDTSVGGNGEGNPNFASDLLNNKGFDFLGLVSNPIFIVGIIAVVGIAVFLKVKK